MARHWTTHLKINRFGWAYLEAMEWEFDHATGEFGLSDIDEHHLARGFSFQTVDAALAFCQEHGIKVAMYNDISTIAR